MKILIFTDAWHPQVSGVVTTVSRLGTVIKEKGHEVKIVTPQDFRITFPLPSYAEIRLPIDFWSAGRICDGFMADAAYIPVPEGSVGLSGRIFCRRNKLPFMTAYTTKLPEYVRERIPIPLRIGYAYERWAHGRSKRILVTTESMKAELMAHGFSGELLEVVGRGVDLQQFQPELRNKRNELGITPPVMLYVGRVSVEKNLEAYLDLDLPGTKVVVGDGPALEFLRGKYPEAVFTGYKFGDELAAYYAAADVFVFPSLTDTFGIVILEAMAAGTPTAAFDVTGPGDIVEQSINGFIGPDLKANIQNCLGLDREAVRQSALKWSWSNFTDRFLEILQGISPAG